MKETVCFRVGKEENMSKKEINVTVIGSGSTYCPELVDGFLKTEKTLHVKRLVLMDIDECKRTVVGQLCVRMLKNAGSDTEVIFSDNLREALVGADFVITQIRVGKLHARYLDETIPLKYNLIGQETTGIGGFFKALRTIPVIKEVAEAMEEICPNAWLINFTNPSGIISEYLQNYTKVKSYGLCNLPINMVDDVKAALGDDADITYVGLNHLSWIISAKKQGEEYIDRLLEEGFAPKVMANIHDDGFDLGCLRAIHGIPASYLQYYYNRETKLAYQKAEHMCRAQRCMEIEEELLEFYRDESIVTKPALLDLRGGHKYSLAAVSLINSIANDIRDVQIVNVRNQGAIDFMKEDDVVEVAAVITAEGPIPVPVAHFENRHIEGMMKIIKEYEKLAVEAALYGDDTAALNALLLHPLVGDYAKARACYEEMKEAHKDYLPQFN